ncbi:MAG: hypothetical protein IJY81_04420, partial [Lachnospiraceae bacterium]|nr:hypothetical protein [Lachnospiraceae bacterium]
MLKKTCKKLIALILCTAIFVTSIPYTKAYANEETAKYPYVMYASSKQEGAIALNADYVCVNGDIATKGTIIKGTNGNYNGIITENSDSNMLYIQDKLNDRYFSSQEKKDSLNLQERYANINEDIGTYNDITLKGDNLNANNVILYSERGDIYIDMDNMSFTGLIYAPCGNVEIEAQNVNLNSVIIIAKTITINATCINVNYNNNIAGIVGIVPDLHDTDDDGLYDVYEDLFATDVKSKDTDNDGLSDYQEIFITNTDELVSCSQAIGVLDGEYDADGDELTALEEVTYGVAWDKADTDEDGLTDYEEIKIYNSNPLNQDTDGDGLKDVEEITLGLDANNIDTDANGIIDGEEYIKQDVNIETYEEGFLDNNLAIPTITNIIAKGDINSRLVVKEYNGHLAKNSKVCIGKVVEISGADIAGGTISFKLTNDYILNDYEIAGYKTNGLLICYHNG